MQPHIPTTSFGRRPTSLASVAAQAQLARAVTDAAKPGSNTPAAVHKWNLFRSITEAKARLGVSDRSLSVLNALLSFHPETALSLPAADAGEGEPPASCALIVFPSNKALAHRAHGMAEKTLRNHLAALVAAGLITRRDSPNGKRYARRDESGQDRFADAFGFDLTPLVLRAGEIEAAAEHVKRERREAVRLKETISLLRRDLSKLITMGLDERLAGPWNDYRLCFLGLLTPVRRIKGNEALQTLRDTLKALHCDITKTLENLSENTENTGNDGIIDRHLSNSNTDPSIEFEPTSNEVGAIFDAVPDNPGSAPGNGNTDANASLPLGLVMEACPDIADYHFGSGKIKTWPGFEELAGQVRPMLGISPDAWQQAVAVLGRRPAAIAIAIILQRSEHSSEASGVPGSGINVNGSPAIRSPGGYLRALTDKAQTGDFALGPVLMALIGQRMKAKRRKTGIA